MKLGAGLGRNESKFWAESFGEQRICIQLTERADGFRDFCGPESQKETCFCLSKTCVALYMRAQN